jgi:hypothetical protein
MNELDQIKKKITEIEIKINALSRESSIPYEVQESFKGRGFVNTSSPDYPPGDFDLNEGFRRDVALTGEIQTITVPAYPYKFLRMTGTNLYIPLHAFAELP